jgi:HEAT repeats
MSRIGRMLSGLTVALFAVLAASATARADNDPAVARGVVFLKRQLSGQQNQQIGGTQNQQIGETALATLAMLKAEVPASDPVIVASVERLRARFGTTGYQSERRGGHDVYEAAVVALALANLPNSQTRTEMDSIARFLLGKQKANGSWDYDNRTTGDTSITQYALLGLWEAENSGASVPGAVWDRAAQWYLSTQQAEGGWVYHPGEGTSNTLSMSAAGVGSLLICRRQLARYRARGDSETSLLLTAVGDEPKLAKYSPSTSSATIDQAARRGIAWIAGHFTTDGKQSLIVGQTPYYFLYGVERVGALAEKDALGGLDWFELGRQMIYATQRGDGGWDGANGDVANTSWAILFVTKATAKTIRRLAVKSLGAGTLLGGRGLPKDLSNLTVAGGRVVSRPMNGAVEGMLSVLEDPRAENADSALAGLVIRYRDQGPSALRPQKDRFRKLLTDRDPGVRRVAAWGLARTADLDVVPALIGALTDRDESVVTMAREGLQLLSRKIDGLGPPIVSTPEQRVAAAERWSVWYATIRPLDLEGQDEAVAPAANAERRSPR